ncbi:MAG: hypothetical protein AAF533_20215 [Acidobacteriota bacterium]
MSITIRCVTLRDLDALADIDRKLWTRNGIDGFTRTHHRAWLEVNPEWFLLAECRGSIVGYTYNQLVHFDPDDLSSYTSCDGATDQSFTRRTHDPRGNGLYGITIGSTMRGAGRALNEALYDKMREVSLRYHLGAPRLPGFGSYMERVENEVGGRATLDFERECALFYAHRCVRLAGARTWPVCPPELRLDLPDVTQPDPVLNWHLWRPEVGLLGVRASYFRDPPSRNYSALTCHDRKLDQPDSGC